MASPVTTSVTELPESRVRVEASVAPDEIKRRLDQAARALGKQLKIPGFRKGKVPAPVVIGRVGRETVLDEAVRESIGRWYSDAISEARIVPIGDPQLDLGNLPPDGEPLTFSIEIGVRPSALLGDYLGLEVPRREPVIADESIDEQIEALRERHAKLETVEDSAKEGDFVVIDFLGSVDGETFEGLEGRDELVELGSGRIAEGMEEELVGASAADVRTADVVFPPDYRAEALAGKTANFEMTVKEVRRKELPPIDDDLASDGAGFDTLAELREDITRKLTETENEAIEREFREAAVDAAADNATIEIPAELVTARAAEGWQQMIHAMSHQGITEETYLAISGKSKDEILEEAKPDTERALRREAVLATVVVAEGIEPNEQEMLEALAGPAQRDGSDPAKLLEKLRANGRDQDLADDLAQRKAVELIAQAAKPVAAPEPPAVEVADEGSQDVS